MGEPVFDPTVLEALGDELGSTAAARRFAAAFLALADGRASGIQWALICGDHEAALTLARSLRVGAVMAGAVSLAATAGEVECALTEVQRCSSRASLAAASLPKAVARASLAMGGYLGDAADSSGVSIR